MFRPCAVIPVYNHERAVGAVVEEVLAQQLPCILVDDGSAPACATALDELVAGGTKQITVLRHPVNRGKGGAVLTGIRHAFRAGYSHALQIDADGQHPPEEIEKLLAKLADYDLVVGARSFKDQAGLARALGNAALNRFASAVASFRIDDLTSGFRAARKSRFREFLHLYPNGFSYPATSTLAFVKAGYDVAFVPGRPVYITVATYNRAQTRHSEHITPVQVMLQP